MLSKADDYPIHQLPEPIAFAGSDRNFYDRYFFNGYSLNGDVFFATALGVYPHLNIMDGAFSVIIDGVQHNLHASRILHMERMETAVGPITVQVLEPLQRLRILVNSPEHGIEADLTFSMRHPAIQEPRFTYRSGPRIIMDYTRMTQNGTYQGWISLKGRRIEISDSNVRGTRDRSWGVRPVGAADSQPVAPPPYPQFYWLWSPMNFDDLCTYYHINADREGEPWNTKAVLVPLATGEHEEMLAAESQVAFQAGTRHARSATLKFQGRGGREIQIALTPKTKFYMSGIGYTNPEWGHGMFKGELAVGYDEIDQSAVDNAALHHLHVQAFCEARLTDTHGPERTGQGILEQLIIGPHKPSGFTDLLDMASP